MNHNRTTFIKLFLIGTLLLNSYTFSFGQEGIGVRKTSFFAGVGLSSYYGDLCKGFNCSNYRPGMGAGFIYKIKNHISIKTEANYYRLYSNDVWKGRNLSFKSGNIEFYSSVMIDYFNLSSSFNNRNNISPYIFAGIGVTYYNPLGKYNGHWYPLRSQKTEGLAYSPMTLIIPFGAGIKIKYSKRFDFMAEAGYRITMTDHLDDISSKYPNKPSNEIDPVTIGLSDKTSKQNQFGKDRGNPNKNDGYFILGLRVIYYLPTVVCPKFR